jgi:hypothetical protein
MGAFDFIAQGVQPVQLADPMRLAAAGMSLADLARRNRQGEEDEQFKALDRQSDQLATQGLMRARQGGDVQSVFADLSRQGEAGAMAARKMAKFMQEQQKADDDSAYKRAQTNDSTAGAAKKTQDMKLDGLKQFATLGTAIASGQAPVNENTQSAMFEVARQVLPPEIVRTMPADPAKFREWAAVMASPEAVAKIAENQAQTSKVQLETQQMPAELAVKQSNARSSSVSAGASASNAQTSRDRLGFDKGEAAAGGGQGKAPSGYRWKADGTLEAIAGGPAAGGGKAAPEAYSKQVGGIQNLQTAITEYQAALKEFGTLDLMSPDARAAMGTKYNNMMLQAKEAYNLGVLNGPDYSILQEVVTNPTSMRGAITSNAAMNTQASELGRIMKQNQENLSKVYKQPNPEAPQDAPKAAAAPAGKTFDSMPDPSGYKGRRMQADDGTIYRSNGSKWVRE